MGFAGSARAEAKGLVGQLGVGMFVSPNGGVLGAATHLDLGYAWQLAQVSLAPGARVSGYWGPQQAISALASVRCALIRRIAIPFLQLATGIGYHNESSDVALAFELGAGLEIPVSPQLSIGAEASYVQLGRRAFENVYLGPTLRIAF